MFNNLVFIGATLFSFSYCQYSGHEVWLESLLMVWLKVMRTLLSRGGLEEAL